MMSTSTEPAKENKCKYIPKFDFGTNIDPSGNQTATIKDLLKELTYENVSKLSGNKLDITYLKTTIRFLRLISGKELKSTIEEHSIVDIKTIKTLINSSYNSDMHLIKFIEPPSLSSKTTIDILTSPPTDDNKKIFKIINNIAIKIAAEIEQEELLGIIKISDMRQFCMADHLKTKQAIDDIILTHIHNEDHIIKEADAYLAEKTREYHRSILPLPKETRINIATYTYLRLCVYLYKLNFEITTKLTIKNDRLGNKQVDFGSICRTLSEANNREILKHTNFMALDEISNLIEEHSSCIAKLVHDASGFKYNKRDVLLDKSRAEKLIEIYLLSANLPNENLPKPIGIIHAISAFCSILHQRKIKTKYGKKSRRHSQKFTSYQKMLDEYNSQNQNNITFTAIFTYLERFKWYVSALEEKKDKYDSQILFELSQLELYKEIYMSLDHKQIKNKTSEYREFIVDAAHNFIRLHGLQNTIYKKIYLV